MHIEDLKRWHWLVISVVIGLLLSMVYSSTASEGGGERRTIGPQQFFWRLGATTKDKAGNDLPVFREIKVYPPIEGKQVVNLDELVISVGSDGKSRSGEYQPRQFVAEIPFSLNRRAQPADPNFSIVDELKQRKARNPKIEFTYVAWASKPWVFGMCTGGSVLLIGVLWPTLLTMLQGAGLGPPPRPKEERMDLSKVRSYKPAPVRTAPSGPTAQDMEQLAAVTTQYERNVGGMRIADGEPAKQGSHAGAAVVEQTARKWEAGPVEPSKVVEQPKEEHEYGGEFYPVDRGAKKKE